jgi:hypothetical protein
MVVIKSLWRLMPLRNPVHRVPVCEWTLHYTNTCHRDSQRTTSMPTRRTAPQRAVRKTLRGEPCLALLTDLAAIASSRFGHPPRRSKVLEARFSWASEASLVARTHR